MNIGPHWFWWILTAACIVWYSTITIYVAIRGAMDIKQMLARLERKHGPTAGPDAPPVPPVHEDA